MFSVYAYVEAFHNLNFGRGSAAAIIGALVIMVLGVALYKFLDRYMDVSR